MSAMGDIDEIKNVKYRYLRALDTKDWAAFTETLTENVVGEYGESLGETTGSTTVRCWCRSCAPRWDRR